MKLNLLLYKMSPSDHLNRQVIATIPVDKFYYMHSFALTENYAVIFKAPVYFKNMMVNAMAGKSMNEFFVQDDSDTTKIYVVSLKDGKVKTFDSNEFLWAVHFGNCYEDENGQIIIHVPTTNNADVLVDMYMRDTYTDIAKMSSINRGSKYNRFIFDFEKETLDIKVLATMDVGNIDLPQFNHDIKGKPQRYTYMAHVWAGTKFNSSYSWPLVKYDDKLGDFSATWAPGMTLAQEVRFIKDPAGKEEDDGILLSVAYNFDRAETSLYVIDARNM
jgi:carotenoid cleavage dioxygenase-like enzyme